MRVENRNVVWLYYLYSKNYNKTRQFLCDTIFISLLLESMVHNLAFLAANFITDRVDYSFIDRRQLYFVANLSIICTEKMSLRSTASFSSNYRFNAEWYDRFLFENRRRGDDVGSPVFAGRMVLPWTWRREYKTTESRFRSLGLGRRRVPRGSGLVPRVQWLKVQTLVGKGSSFAVALARRQGAQKLGVRQHC